MPTLKQIAQKVGVSISTVSRVINGDNRKHISEDTKRKVWEAAKELKYVLANTKAKQLQQGMRQVGVAAKQIGCIVSIPNNRYNHPYFTPILAGIEDKLKELGSALLFVQTQDEIAKDLEQHKLFGETVPDGLIFVESVDPALYRLLKEKVPACVGIDISDPTVPVIVYERIAAAKAAVRHLLECGHRKIGFIGGAGMAGQLEREKRYRGYLEALTLAHFEPNPDWVINAEWDVDTSYEAMRRMLRDCEGNWPTAMFCASDMMAIPAMRAAAEHGLRIPEDIAFIGLDNIDLSKYTSPPLSTIHIPKYEMGLVAAKTLLDFIDHMYPMPFKISLPFELIIRQSTGDR